MANNYDGQMLKLHGPMDILLWSSASTSSVGDVADRGQSSSDKSLIVQVLKLKCSGVDSWVWERSENSDKRMLVQTAQTAEIKQKSFFIRQHGS